MTLRPDRRLIGRIGLAAAAALCTGFVIVLHLPLPAALRVPLAAAWLAVEFRALAGFLCAAARVERLHVDADGLRGLFGDGIWRPLTLRPGSIVCGRHAWLRLSDGQGPPFGVPLSAALTGAAGWRRLCLWYRARR